MEEWDEELVGPDQPPHDCRCKEGDKHGIKLDYDAGTISLYMNGKFVAVRCAAASRDAQRSNCVKTWKKYTTTKNENSSEICESNNIVSHADYEPHPASWRGALLVRAL